MELDDLPIEGPVFELADYAPHPRWDLEITLDEWVSHELEDAVADLVTELPRSGVTAVAHEDRERILVESGGVPRAELQHWLERWWAATLARYESLGGD